MEGGDGEGCAGLGGEVGEGGGEARGGVGHLAGAVVAGAAEGEVGAEGVGFGWDAEGGEGGVEVAVEADEMVEVAGEAEPEDARAAGVGEGAGGGGVEGEGAVGGGDGAEGVGERGDEGAGGVAEEFEGEVGSGGIGPADGKVEAAAGVLGGAEGVARGGAEVDGDEEAEGIVDGWHLRSFLAWATRTVDITGKYRWLVGESYEGRLLYLQQIHGQPGRPELAMGGRR